MLQGVKGIDAPGQFYERFQVLWKFDEYKDATEVGPPRSERAELLDSIQSFSSVDRARSSAARCAFN